ncbi:hypothetical protein GP486_002822 [Trichoglossum hirsutum]|uniref:50S ribosomal protein L14 n=1 Tax=Trichoglossum hirsutum TaxID=265104 RepID=A0A9P8RRC8_9PEZI|nr:hypothetical protein GP486_002822 [Trichoglossum hirsutum]
MRRFSAAAGTSRDAYVFVEDHRRSSRRENRENWENWNIQLNVRRHWHGIAMIQLKTMLNCIDNSGAAVVECTKVLRMKRHAKIGNSGSQCPRPTYGADDVLLGDRIIVVVQKQRSFGPETGGGGSVLASAANKVRRGDIRHAVVVRTAKKLQRPDGSVVKFDDNACVLINKNGDPIGTRLNGEPKTFCFPRIPGHGKIIDETS